MARKTKEKEKSSAAKKKRIAQGAAAAGTAGLLTGIGETVRRRRNRGRMDALKSRLRGLRK
jgi:hypothetical protein